jgi:predicted nucleic acid-binding Zn ribbon protein
MQQSLKITDVSDALSAMKEKKLEEIEAEHHERMSKILEEHQEKIAQIEDDHLPLYYLNKLTDGEKAPKQVLLLYFALPVPKMPKNACVACGKSTNTDAVACSRSAMSAARQVRLGCVLFSTALPTASTAPTTVQKHQY